MAAVLFLRNRVFAVFCLKFVAATLLCFRATIYIITHYSTQETRAIPPPPKKVPWNKNTTLMFPLGFQMFKKKIAVITETVIKF